MHLIAPLVSGIANAGNGSAWVYRRGTSTLATLYSSFEGDGFASSSLDSNDRVILDSYGRAVVYVNDICDVAVYDADGTLQIMFTAGFSAAGIEVRSSAFTGSEYDFSAANTPGLPTSLQAVLDLWLTAHAQTDWGLPSSLQPFIIVTDPAYGAKGDGVTDDTTAIQAAIAAAGQGGVVFFPAGTYRTTSALSITHVRVTLLGVGASTPQGSASAQQSEIRVDSSSSSVIALGAAANKLTAVALTLSSAQANSGTLLDMTAPFAATVELRQCALGGSNSTGHLVELISNGSLTASDTRFVVGGAASSAVHSVNTSIGITLINCSLTTSQVAYSGDGLVYGNNISALGCGFTPDHVSGTLTCVQFNTGSGTLSGTVTGCSFGTGNLSGSGHTVGMDLQSAGASSTFTESGNLFPNATATSTPSFVAYAVTTTALHVSLRTREGRVFIVADSSATVTLPTDQYGTIILRTTNAAVTLVGTPPVPGAMGSIFVYYTLGGAGTLMPSTGFFNASTATTANTHTYLWQYVSAVANATLRMMITVDARDHGAGA